MIPPIELVSKQLILLITQDTLKDLVIILNKRMNNSRINETIKEFISPFSLKIRLM